MKIWKPHLGPIENNQTINQASVLEIILWKTWLQPERRQIHRGEEGETETDIWEIAYTADNV